MKTLFTLVLAMIGLNAVAADSFNYTFFGNQGRNRIYLSCYYVENAVDNFLAEIGATDIDTTCTGGIDYGYYTPVNVRTKFTMPTESKQVKLRSDFNANCFFDTEFIQAFVREFDNIKKVSGSSFCTTSNTSYRYTLQIN